MIISILQPPLYEGVLDFSKIDGNEGAENFYKKIGLRQNGRCSLEMGGCHIILRFFWRFLVMQYRKKSWCVCLFFTNKHVLQNNSLNIICDDWHYNSFISVDNYNSCIDYSCKWQIFCLIFLCFLSICSK